MREMVRERVLNTPIHIHPNTSPINVERKIGAITCKKRTYTDKNSFIIIYGQTWIKREIWFSLQYTIPVNMSGTIRLITKKKLCEVLDCTYNTGRVYAPNNYKLRKFFMTDQFINEKLGISIEEYNRIRVFTLEQTRTIVKEFKITMQELEDFS